MESLNSCLFLYIVLSFCLMFQASSGRELLTFLFNDFLLFSTIKASSNNWQTQLFESKTNLRLELYRLVS